MPRLVKVSGDAPRILLNAEYIYIYIYIYNHNSINTNNTNNNDNNNNDNNDDNDDNDDHNTHNNNNDNDNDNSNNDNNDNNDNDKERVGTDDDFDGFVQGACDETVGGLLWHLRWELGSPEAPRSLYYISLYYLRLCRCNVICYDIAWCNMI